MIIVSINGRLGNQMFGFALYRRLMQLGKDVYVDLMCDRVSGQEGIVSEIKYNAGIFQPDYRVADEAVVREMLADGQDRNIWKRWEYRLAPSRCRYYEEKRQGTYHGLIFRLDDIYLHGYWQTEKYFAGAAQEVRRMYRFPDLYTDRQRRLLEEIQGRRSVSVHVRRGDYLKHPEIYGTVGLQYYQDAMKYLQERKENLHFYLFSDDPAWVRQNFSGNHITVVEDEGDQLTDNLDMALMAACRDNIIANSSFSWWAAWLNKNPEKTVIAPKVWEANQKMKDIWCEGWVRM